MKRILVDDIAYQLNLHGIKRVWNELFKNVKDYGYDEKNGYKFIQLRRSPHSPKLFDDVIDYQELDYRFPAVDRINLDRIVEEQKIDLFISTFYTSVTKIKSLLIVYDLIPERFNFDELNRGWLERKLAILFSTSYLSISHQTQKDLSFYYPFTKNRVNDFASLGVNLDVFYVPSDSLIKQFKSEYLIDNYFVIVGDRKGQHGYKNANFLFDVAMYSPFRSFNFFFVGGEKLTRFEMFVLKLKGINFVQRNLQDDELTRCYAGSRGLIYPSQYEGFGLPIIEAVACGTPVVAYDSSPAFKYVEKFGINLKGKSPKQVSKILNSKFLIDLKIKSLSNSHHFTEVNSWKIFSIKFIETIKDTLEEGELNLIEPNLKAFSIYTHYASLIQSRKVN